MKSVITYSVEHNFYKNAPKGEIEVNSFKDFTRAVKQIVHEVSPYCFMLLRITSAYKIAKDLFETESYVYADCNCCLRIKFS